MPIHFRPKRSCKCHIPPNSGFIKCPLPKSLNHWWGTELDKVIKQQCTKLCFLPWYTPVSSTLAFGMFYTLWRCSLLYPQENSQVTKAVQLSIRWEYKNNKYVYDKGLHFQQMYFYKHAINRQQYLVSLVNISVDAVFQHVFYQQWVWFITYLDRYRGYTFKP